MSFPLYPKDFFKPPKQNPHPQTQSAFPPQVTWKAPHRRKNDWEHHCREAQVQGLGLLYEHWAENNFFSILQHPWSDALYPSLVKVWGIDSLTEESALYLDQVWLYRSHRDKPQQWHVIATTTDFHPLTDEVLADGSHAEEGTRAYLEYVLSEMGDSWEKGVRDLSVTLKDALATGQLRYMHLHSGYNRSKQAWYIKYLYEFPIYPAIYSEMPQQLGD